jgi:mRNA interferase HicA
MKRRDLISHLSNQGCISHREGAKHSIIINPENGHLTAVPRHREIPISLVKKICHQLDIIPPKEKA